MKNWKILEIALLKNSLKNNILQNLDTRNEFEFSFYVYRAVENFIKKVILQLLNQHVIKNDIYGCNCNNFFKYFELIFSNLIKNSIKFKGKTINYESFFSSFDYNSHFEKNNFKFSGIKWENIKTIDPSVLDFLKKHVFTEQFKSKRNKYAHEISEILIYSWKTLDEEYDFYNKRKKISFHLSIFLDQFEAFIFDHKI